MANKVQKLTNTTALFKDIRELISRTERDLEKRIARHDEKFYAMEASLDEALPRAKAAAESFERMEIRLRLPDARVEIATKEVDKMRS